MDHEAAPHRDGEHVVVPSTEEAVSASLACARVLGLPAEDPEVVAEGYSVRVRLRPAPVVTRVVTLGRRLRPEPLPWLQREVAVAQFLAEQGQPVVAPWGAPGPHLAEGLEVSLWEWVEHVPGVVAAADFGPMLGALHEALAGCPEDLPVLVGPLTDIDTALEVSSHPTLHRAAEELVALARTWPRQPLHGDVHTGNLLLTSSGPRWNDFEDVCSGPVEWDLGSLTITDDAVAAYPGPIDRARLRDCRDLRRLQVLASLLVLDDSDDDSEAGDVALMTRIVSHLDRRAGR
ncbi:phosphotransferase [Nocardioides sp.]|uniref:phosphotransferase n=1 Tax=Nocardioides sp. TaxID=35761 RepID=UPI003517559A